MPKKFSGRLVINDCIADAFLQNALLRPKDYSVVATLNLNGDYISDMLAAQVGALVLLPVPISTTIQVMLFLRLRMVRPLILRGRIRPILVLLFFLP